MPPSTQSVARRVGQGRRWPRSATTEQRETWRRPNGTPDVQNLSAGDCDRSVATSRQRRSSCIDADCPLLGARPLISRKAASSPSRVATDGLGVVLYEILGLDPLRFEAVALHLLSTDEPLIARLPREQPASPDLGSQVVTSSSRAASPKVRASMSDLVATAPLGPASMLQLRIRSATDERDRDPVEETEIQLTDDESKGRPTAIDLFSGAGGLSLGLEQAGFDVLAAVHSDPVHALVYAHNLPRTTVDAKDIETLDGDDVRAAARAGADPPGDVPGRTSLIAWRRPELPGFPRLIGSRDPADARNSLVLEFARLVAELQPRYFILENVPGLLSAPYRPMLDRLIAMLKEAGYELDDSPWKLDAYHFQVPQHRRRLFLVGSRIGLARPQMPSRSGAVTVGEAIGDLMAISRVPAPTALDEIELLPEELEALSAAAGPYVRRLRGARDPNDLSARRRWDSTVLTGVAGTVHSEDVRKRLASIPLGEWDPISRLPKLDPAKPSPTLRAGTGREHGSHTSVRPVHYASPRVVTVREAARLHAFPDWFRFHATWWHALRQIGNSVPPPLARAIGSSIVSALGAQPRRRPIVSMGDPSRLDHSLEDAARILDVPRSQLPPARRRVA